MKENILEEASCVQINTTSNNENKSNRNRKRNRSNNSSFLSQTLTSSSESSNSRCSSPSPNKSIDSSDEFEPDSKYKKSSMCLIRPKNWNLSVEDEHQKAMLANRPFTHSTPLSTQTNDLKEQLSNHLNKLRTQQQNSFMEDYTSYSNCDLKQGFQQNNYSNALFDEKMQSQQHMDNYSLMLNHDKPATVQPFNQQKPINFCCVCGDRASGKHYGVMSCDGCRGFFKRSIRGNMEYVCKENNQCIIDVSRRNQCQACRLRKCLEVKMNKDAVQHQRPPRSNQLKRDTSSSLISPLNNEVPRSSSADLFTGQNSLLQAPPPPLPQPLAAHHQFSNLGPIYSPNSIINNARYSPYGLPTRNAALDAADKNGLFSQPAHAAAVWSLFNNLNDLRANPNFQIANEALQKLNGNNNCQNGANRTQNEMNIASTAVLYRNTLLANAFKNFSAVFSPNNNNMSCNQAMDLSSNTSSSFLSSGYNTCDENNSDTTNKENGSNQSDLKSESEEVAQTDDCNKMHNSNASLAHIMNWIKNTPTLENIGQKISRVLVSTMKWAKSQRHISSLNTNDQNNLISENLGELFILHMAEHKTTCNEIINLIFENEKDQEKRILFENFQNMLDNFQLARIDPVEYYFLKSICLFKSEFKRIQEKMKIEKIQEEFLLSLLNYNKSNHPELPRFGHLLILYANLRKYASKLVEEVFFKDILGKTDMIQLIDELNKAF